MEPSDLGMTSILALVRLRLIELVLSVDPAQLIEPVPPIDPAQLNALAPLITLVQFALQKYQPPHETKPNPPQEEQNEDVKMTGSPCV